MFRDVTDFFCVIFTGNHNPVALSSLSTLRRASPVPFIYTLLFGRGPKAGCEL